MGSAEGFLPYVHLAFLHPKEDCLSHVDEQPCVHHAWDHFDSHVHLTTFVYTIKLPVQDKIPIVTTGPACGQPFEVELHPKLPGHC